MSYGVDGDVEREDYVNGRLSEQEQMIATAQASSLPVTSGISTNLIGFDAGGNPVAVVPTGDSNGAGFSADGVNATVTLPQNLKTTGTPTFAGLTIGTGGTQATKILSASAALDFGNTAAQSSADLTIALTGAVVGDAVIPGVPNGSVNANSCFTAWVSAADTVTVRFNNYSAAAIDPASGTFRVAVIRF